MPSRCFEPVAACGQPIVLRPFCVDHMAVSCVMHAARAAAPAHASWPLTSSCAPARQGRDAAF